MDFFGIGNAIKACAKIYFRSAIQTGRTTALIHSLKEGDRVYFRKHEEAKWFERRLKDFGVQGVDCLAWSKIDVGVNFRQGKAKGNAVLDHMLIEEMYLKAIDDCSRNIKGIEDELSTRSSVVEAEPTRRCRPDIDMRRWFVD